jgi:hypothetical protein
MLPKPVPTSPPRICKTLANGPAADALSCEVPANLYSHLEHEVDLVRVVELRDLEFSELCGGCGFR